MTTGKISDYDACNISQRVNSLNILRQKHFNVAAQKNSIFRNGQQWHIIGQRNEEINKLRAELSIEKLMETVFDSRFVVRNGPFKNMRYTPNTCGGGLLPKILGSYEDCLYPWINEISAKNYTNILNIGCAEGYFAVGFAHKGFAKKVVAYDTNPIAMEYMKELISMNTLKAELDFVSICDTSEITRYCIDHSMIFCDIEGEELNLLDPERNPELLKTDMIVELHDVFIPGITNVLVDRFIKSHKIEIIYDSIKSIDNYIFPKIIPKKIKEVVMYENRPFGMSWMRLTVLS